MNTYQIDAELKFEDSDVKGSISVTFQAEDIEKATQMAKEMFGAILSECEVDIFRVDYIEQDV